MSPGYDRPDQQDFRRAIGADCLFCHDGYLVQGDRIPEGIDCQRCHGPGRRHAEGRRLRERFAANIRSAIINPAGSTAIASSTFACSVTSKRPAANCRT